MRLFDPNNPNEKKKMIAAGVLGLVAIIVLGYVFFGGPSKPTTNSVVTTRPGPTPGKGGNNVPPPDVPPADDNSIFQPISYSPTAPSVTEGNRNIFAYYEAPSPTPKPIVVQTPTPTPTPPLTATTVSPSNVYARTPGDFSLQLVGDKFTPAVHIIIDGRDLPTRFISAQQLFATVPASWISTPGPRSVMARSPDGKLYSNAVSLNVALPPDPNQSFTYVGLIGKPHFNDTAVLQIRSSKELINVQRGQDIGGRFRVVSISEREVAVIDTQLKIPHKIPFTSDSTSNSPYRPPARPTDDEP